MWYNEERKREFLAERKKDADISNNIESFFDNSSFFEWTHDRDLCDWSSAEIISWLKYLSTPKAQSLVQCVNSLKIYADWCLVHLMVADGQNHFYEVTTEMICECIDMHKFSQLIIPSREAFVSQIDKLPNANDKYFLLAIYEGLPRQAVVNGSINNLTPGGFEYNGKCYLISDLLRRIIKEANEQKEYESMAGNFRVYNLDMSDDHIIKRIDSKRANLNRDSFLNIRFAKAKEFIGWNSQMLIKDIAESGRLEMIRSIMKKYNVSADAAYRFPYRGMHEKVYGKIQNLLTYAYTYGKFI